MEQWPHQQYALDEVLAAIDRGERRILLTSPTGGGKTRIMCDLIEHWTAQGLRVALYTNRRLLVEQTSRVMGEAGIDHGVRAAGFDEQEIFAPVQVCSIQTENSRVLKKQRWELHDADRVLIDEAHSQTGKVARRLLDMHAKLNAAYVGLTATPLDLADMYDTLIVAGRTSELRDCGALVHCNHYGPDEPDLREFQALRAKLEAGQNPSEAQVAKAMMVPGLFGRVLKWFGILNPERKPTILFAPGVKESIWFAEQFCAAGISAAHIDGKDVWVNGKIEKTSQEARERVLLASRNGEITVLCNRFVLREGIDAPWLAHGILATIFGSLQSYLQSGGRLLRSHADIHSVTVQDHGGNWHRHGSLNADREWLLTHTANNVSGMRIDALRQKKEREPIRCPDCSRIVTGDKCVCGWQFIGYKSRPCVQTDGTLKEMIGDIYRPRRLSRHPNGPKIWERMYHRSRTDKGDRSFRAAAALFAQENNWQWPDPTWPLMPTEPLDWFLHVRDVPRERLTGVPA